MTKTRHQSGAKKLVFRVDAGSQMGCGHAMRCLALAQAFQDAGGEAVFVMRDAPENILNRLKAESIAVKLVSGSNDLAETTTLARELQSEWIVLDGYHLDGAYQKALKSAGFLLLVIDDYGSSSNYFADLILNINTPRADLYAGRTGEAKLLLGTRYFLLRKEFSNATPVKPGSEVRRILLSFGGSDPANVTLRAAQALLDLPLELVVVIGPANPHLPQLQALQEKSKATLEILTNSSDMAGVMQRVDVAITAASVTCFELAHMGIPQLVVMSADNQKYAAETMAQAGACIYLGWHQDLAPEKIRQETLSLVESASRREQIRLQGQKLVDGQGARRILREMQSRSLHARPATLDDARLIFDWANDPQTRAASFSSSAITWENHLNWFSTKLGHPDHVFYILETPDDTPAALVRFDHAENSAEISVNVAPEFRGQGLGSAIIARGCRESFKSRSAPVHAYIKPENVASVRAFAQADFETQPRATVNGCAAEHLILSPGNS